MTLGSYIYDQSFNNHAASQSWLIMVYVYVVNKNIINSCCKAQAERLTYIIIKFDNFLSVHPVHRPPVPILW